MPIYLFWPCEWTMNRRAKAPFCLLHHCCGFSKQGIIQTTSVRTDAWVNFVWYHAIRPPLHHVSNNITLGSRLPRIQGVSKAVCHQDIALHYFWKVKQEVIRNLRNHSSYKLTAVKITGSAVQGLCRSIVNDRYVKELLLLTCCYFSETNAF